MEVILKQPVRNLGDADDVVKVKNGYARNYLIPQGLAVMATAAAKKAMEEKKRQAAHKVEFVKKQALEEAEKLANLKVIIETLAGADGKLFGSVTSTNIVESLKEQGFEVDKSMIRMPQGQLKQVGDYPIKVVLYGDISAQITVSVLGEAML